MKPERASFDRGDSYDLKRFVEAQSRAWEQVRSELRQGSKRGHWMWFIFPQMKGLGMSETSRFYGIGSREEAVAYLRHAELGPRLVECTRLVLEARARTAEQIFGEVDALKFHSSMTLFAEVSLRETAFAEAIARFFDGEKDAATLDLLE
jgi:uncharacterized protein (DUF1810 family)